MLLLKNQSLSVINLHILIIGLLAMSSFHLKAQPYGYLYGKTISINPSIVTGTISLTNFPLLLKTTDADLRSKSNGGFVESEYGYDIVFTTDACASPISYQVESYDPATGELICWVKIPTLNYNANTVINMYYGNPLVNSSTSSASTWGSEFSTVLHLNNNPNDAAPQMIDACGKTNSGTCIGTMTSTNSVLGKIGNCITFDEVDDGISIPDFDYTSSFTISFWFNVSEVNGASYQYLYSHGNFGATHATSIYFGEDFLGIAADRKMLKNIFQDTNDATNTSGLDAGTTLVDGNWHYYTFVVGNSGGAIVYIDAVLTNSLSFLGGNSYDPATNIYIGCRSDLSGTRFYGGKIDEFRILSEPKSANWIATEFNNQNNPSSNITLGAHTTSSLICQPLPIQLISFNGNVINDDIQLNWETAQEINCHKYVIEKSTDAEIFIPIASISPFRNNNDRNYYSYTDLNQAEEITYYRLKQIDTDSSFYYSNIISIHLLKKNNTVLFPNPFTNELKIVRNSSELKSMDVKLIDKIGQIVFSKNYNSQENSINLTLDFLNAGMYYLELSGVTKERFIIVKK